MTKEFLQANDIRDHAIKVADQIYQDGFIPTVIVVGLRGGTTFGNMISEYFKMILPVDMPPLYAAVVSHSYMGSNSSMRVYIDGWTLSPEHLRKSDRVLLVDDIFDSGLTINVLAETILNHNITSDHLRIVVHDYKIRTYRNQDHRHYPHYYSRKMVIERPEDDNWIHYTSHELDGLTEEEVKAHYPPDTHPYLLKLLTIRKENLKIFNDKKKSGLSGSN